MPEPQAAARCRNRTQQPEEEGRIRPTAPRTGCLWPQFPQDTRSCCMCHHQWLRCHQRLCPIPKATSNEPRAADAHPRATQDFPRGPKAQRGPKTQHLPPRLYPKIPLESQSSPGSHSWSSPPPHSKDGTINIPSTLITAGTVSNKARPFIQVNRCFPDSSPLIINSSHRCLIYMSSHTFLPTTPGKWLEQGMGTDGA